MMRRRNWNQTGRVLAACFGLALAAAGASCGGADSTGPTPPIVTGDSGSDADASAPDSKPDVTPDVTPDTKPDVKPDVTPDVTPDVKPDGQPDAEPDAEPDAGEGGEEDASDAAEEEACVATAELCDGLDNDCDGTIDNAPTGVGEDCTLTGLLGPCATGKTKCDAGSISCEQTVQPGIETCNNVDDNCDGTVDNDVSGVGDSCTVTGQQGPCATGTQDCQSGNMLCNQTVNPGTETCNSVDDDCNGTVDDSSALDGKDCTSTALGVCTPGKTLCTAGVESCVSTVTPGTLTETCNGTDDDCNGTVDDVIAVNADCAVLLPGAPNVTDWKCEAGACGIVVCAPGFLDCDLTGTTGCEVDGATEVANCGGCAKACSAVNATPTCVAGACQLTCSAGFGNCDTDVSNGCEQSTTDSVLHCGGCGKACESTTGTPTCTNSACVIACNTGLDDCDNNVDNGCEINTNTDVLHCGGCSKPCSTAGGTPSCDNGVCKIACSAGFGDCNNDPADGCETNLNTDQAHCGLCTTPCSTVGGTPTCNNGTCSIACTAGYGNCDNNAANGCEITFATDTANCGSCGAACSSNNGSPSCTGGVCSITCTNGFGNCDTDLTNGCETNTTNTVGHCGGCGLPCNSSHGTAACSNSQCSITSCDSNWGNCDNNPVNGCEADFKNDELHCGNCTTVCSSSGGAPSCNAGTCGIACNPGLADCTAAAGCETNINTDLNNCGGCGLVCARANASAQCVAGACSILACNAGWENCDGNDANGCETNTLTTVAHCGGCNLACSANHGSPVCASGSCVISCAANYMDCNMNPRADGCEAFLPQDVLNCGGCGNACSTVHGTPTCSGGVCGINCAAGYGDCNSQPGCETNTLTSVLNCGGCNLACSTNHTVNLSCGNGVCNYACQAGWGDCDGNKANGCEADLTNTTTNCGTCGHACTPNASQHVAAVGCTAGQCVVTACQTTGTPLFYNQNHLYADGCECADDPIGNTPSQAMALGTIGVNATIGLTRNLTPTAADADWYTITFSTGPSCNFNPRIWLTNAAAGIYLRVFTDVNAQNGVPCSLTETGLSSKANLVDWQFNYRTGTTCGHLNCSGAGAACIDTNPGTPSFINIPVTYWVQVYSTVDMTTCAPYTINFSN